jgi:hypothetical protein
VQTQGSIAGGVLGMVHPSSYQYVYMHAS